MPNVRVVERVRRTRAADVRDASVGLAVIALAFWVVAVHEAHFSAMGHLGLVSILGWTYFVGLALAAVAFGLEVTRDVLRPTRLVAMILVLDVFLFATAAAIEPTAALTDSWFHAGFTQYIVTHGHALMNYDARFSWPGSFSLAALFVSFTGQVNALGFLRWFPFVVEVAYVIPLLVIARYSGASRRAGYLGIALFYSANWIYQDYFSPQALNYFFYLSVIAAVLAGWRARTTRHVTRGLTERLSMSLRALRLTRFEGHDAIANWPPAVTLAVLGLLGLIVTASAMSHQLTPYALLLGLGAALVTRRLGRPELIVLTGLAAVAWLSLGASNYWVGHLQDIFGSVGQISGTIGSNVTDRLTGSASHRFIVDARIAITGAIYLLGVIGALRRACTSRYLEAAVLAPFVLLALQNYGGEGLLRVTLFGLPFVALLAASALAPRVAGTIAPWWPGRAVRRRFLQTVVVVVVVLGFALATTVVRGGNDAYSAFSLGDVKAVNLAYSLVRPGQSIGMVAPYLPVGQRDLGSVSLFFAASFTTPSIATDEKEMLKKRPAVVVLSATQEAWGEIVAGYPVGWQRRFEKDLLDHGYRVRATWSSATVLVAGAPT
jgi:hypothetical protein